MVTAYVTLEEYGSLSGKNAEMTDALLLQATLKVEQMTFGRASSDLTPYQADRVKIATCQQADYLFDNADIIEQEGVTSYSVLGMSVSFQSKDYWGKNNYSRTAYDTLLPTNLLWKGV